MFPFNKVDPIIIDVPPNLLIIDVFNDPSSIQISYTHTLGFEFFSFFFKMLNKGL